MGRALDDLALRLWVHLVRVGGYSTVALCGYHLSDASHAEVNERLKSLAANGMARERHAGGRAVYGVTTACVAPPGYEHLMQFRPD